MEMLLLLICPVLAGVLAQRWKGRLGVVWGGAVLLLELAVFAFAGVVAHGDTALSGSPYLGIALVLGAVIVGGLPGLAIVATLPRKRPRAA